MAHILIAEDVSDVLFAYEAILSAAGHTCTTASNGVEAKACLCEKKFDLIVTDLLMPKLDGIQLATHAQSLENTPKLLVVTGGGDRISPHAALRMGESFFDASLMKPVSRSDLLGMVDNLLRERG